VFPYKIKSEFYSEACAAEKPVVSLNPMIIALQIPHLGHIQRSIPDYNSAYWASCQ
jgi:hypothetical protein